VVVSGQLPTSGEYFRDTLGTSTSGLLFTLAFYFMLVVLLYFLFFAIIVYAKHRFSRSTGG
jgi:hypothetical protein